MTFNPDKCAIPTVYVEMKKNYQNEKKGDNIYYISHGTQYECPKTRYWSWYFYRTK